MEMTVVIPTCNGADTIGRQLHALSQQESRRQWEILVVDNRSTDRTVEVVRGWAGRDSKIRLISAEREQNLAYARNLAVQHTSAPFVAFVDDDDLVAPGWVSAMMSSLDLEPMVGSRFEYRLLNPPELLAGRAHVQSEELLTICDTPVVTGGGLGIHSEVWTTVGGNDESWSFSGEDLEFSLRATELGIRPTMAEDAVYHIAFRRGGRSAFRQARRAARARVELAHRFGGGSRRGRWPTPPARTWWWIATRSLPAAAGYHRELWGRRVGDEVGHTEQTVRLKLGGGIGAVDRAG
ncbi:MAG: glycosyltransferase family A protein [Actinomycetota bacterium]